MKESKSKSKKGFVICVILMAALILSLITNVIQYKKSIELRDNLIFNLEQEWYRLSRMCHYVDLYINDYAIPYPDGIEQCSLFVNQSCHNFTGGHISELSSVMRNWLTLSYAYIFANLTESEPIDSDLALQIVRDMNSDLASICNMILDMDKGTKKNLLDWDSNEYKEVLDIVKTASQKYVIETNSYFKKERHEHRVNGLMG